jgi:uncharacterized membrane protein YkgB
MNKWFSREVVTNVTEIGGALSVTVGVGLLAGAAAALILGGIFAMLFSYLADSR